MSVWAPVQDSSTKPISLRAIQKDEAQQHRDFKLAHKLAHSSSSPTLWNLENLALSPPASGSAHMQMSSSSSLSAAEASLQNNRNENRNENENDDIDDEELARRLQATYDANECVEVTSDEQQTDEKGEEDEDERLARELQAQFDAEEQRQRLATVVGVDLTCAGTYNDDSSGVDSQRRLYGADDADALCDEDDDEDDGDDDDDVVGQRISEILSEAGDGEIVTKHDERIASVLFAESLAQSPYAEVGELSAADLRTHISTSAHNNLNRQFKQIDAEERRRLRRRGDR
jgi:hypothetical protein